MSNFHSNSPEGIPDKAPFRTPDTDPTHDPNRLPHEPEPDHRPGRRADNPDVRVKEPNAPHTTTDDVTSPKFGSAGSGGAELEPGPERP
jgi:hypothetical protein